MIFLVHTIVTDNHIVKILEKLSKHHLFYFSNNLLKYYLFCAHFHLDSSSVPVTRELSSTAVTNETFTVPLFQTKPLPIDPNIVAPDGSLVRELLTTTGGSMAQFELPPGMISNAVEHRTVYEIWYFLSGQGEFWRKQHEKEETVIVNTDICITIPVGTKFQFRTVGRKPLIAVAITMPPWPGGNEAILTEGIWNASLSGIENSSLKLSNSIHQWLIIIAFLIVKVC